MKLCAAQTRPAKGDIQKNIQAHKKFIELAVSSKADVIIFPELSLTGYEPVLAKELATMQDDKRFDEFQSISDTKEITIGAGIPTNDEYGIHISMIYFQPHQQRQTYSKQFLHSSEFPFFTGGKQQLLLNIGSSIAAPGICYETSVPAHSENAFKRGAEIYLASVADTAVDVEKAEKNLSRIAKQYSMTVVMANCLGPNDNFIAAGKSSFWNTKGMLAGQLNDIDEGLLIFDTETEKLVQLIQ